MPKISYVSGQLHRISDQLAAAEKKQFQVKQETEDEPEQIVPELEPYIRARFDEMMRLRRDMISRLTEHICRFSSEKEMLDQRLEKIGKASGELESMLSRIEGEAVPKFNDSKFKSKLTDQILMLENIRLDTIRITAKNAASPVQSVRENKDPAQSSFSVLSGGELFRKGFFLFLPLMIVSLIAVLLISAAFVTAWLLAF